MAKHYSIMMYAFHFVVLIKGCINETTLTKCLNQGVLYIKMISLIDNNYFYFLHLPRIIIKKIINFELICKNNENCIKIS